MRGDVRGRRVVVVPDSVVNAPREVCDQLSILTAAGWGVIALPPPELEGSMRVSWMDAVVEQVVTFLDDDYDVAIADGDDAVAKEFAVALEATGRMPLRLLDG